MELFFEELVRQILIISTSENYFFGHSATPHGHFTKVATDLRPESRDTSSSPGARDQNRGSEKLGLRPPPLRTPSPCRQSTPPPPRTRPSPRDSARGRGPGTDGIATAGCQGGGATDVTPSTTKLCVSACSGSPGHEPPHPPGDGRERRQQSLGGTRLSRPRSPLEPRRLPPPLPPPPPPGAAPQPPASVARTPRAAATLCRPLGPRPRPLRRARRRLRLRAVDAAATDADASSSAPPSFSLKANKHHGGGRRPPPTPASERPAHRRLANILASHWLILLGATIPRRAGDGSLRAVAQARSPFPPASRSNEPAQRAPARPPVLSSRSLCA
ncbi:uncharacterized protein LOC142831622 [Microtus pennsylvanicus]|uniref:uncharacterized protein LOC142831622 n=1 Tax=Microtus pennsylvanicus TaxID=10058 RepID=UPI003F6B0557